MKEYVYPAVFHGNDDGTYTIFYPDLPGCVTEGKSLGESLVMAQKALTQWVEYLSDKAMEIPEASNAASVSLDAGEFCNLVRADVRDKRAVRRTVSIPKWMDEAVSAAGLSLSKVLQEALSNKLNPA